MSGISAVPKTRNQLVGFQGRGVDEGVAAGAAGAGQGGGGSASAPDGRADDDHVRRLALGVSRERMRVG